MNYRDLNSTPIESVAVNLGKALTGKKSQSCLVCPSSDAMQVNNDNTIHCYSCGFHGGPIKTVATYYNLNLKTQTSESINKFKELMNLNNEATFMSKENNTNIVNAVKLWKESIPVAETPECLKYFDSRGITLAEIPIDLRFNTREFSLVLPFRNLQGEITGVHRTFLTENYENVKDESKRSKKRALGRCNGLIMAYKDSKESDSLIIAEGLEKTIALRSLLGPANYGVAYSTGTLKSHETVKQIKSFEFKHVLICADNDLKCQGTEAASVLFFNLGKLGISAQILKPNMVGKDWDDLINGDVA